MPSRGTVYVIAGSPVRRRAIAGALRAGRDPPDVRPLSRVPSQLEHTYHTVIVMDLHGGAELEPPPPPTRGLGTSGWVLIAASRELVPAAWLAVAREPHVALLLTATGDSVDEARLRGTVTAVLEHARARVVSGVLRRCGRLFEGREDVVRAVVADPWRIRWPRDLAQAVGVSLSDLKRSHLPPPVSRLEHLITLVRWCGYEFLTLEAHLPSARALEAVGVRDRSDFRRQLRRVRAGWRDEMEDEDRALWPDDDANFD